MFTIFALFFLLTIALSGITTIPVSVALLVVAVVIFKKSWIFFLAFLLGLLLDLILIRPPGYTSLIFTIFVFLIWLYEKKFETQTLTFVFFATFLGSAFYLRLFGYQMVFLQAFINASLAVLFFKFLWLKLGPRSETT